MSRQPMTPNDSEQPGGSGQTLPDVEAGRRFSGNDELLRLEQEMLAEGRELPNRAIPIEYHAQERDYTETEIAEIIETEVSEDHPNRELIGYLNEVKP